MSGARWPKRLRWLVAFLALAGMLALPASAANPTAAHKRLDQMESALDKAIADAKVGKLDPADVRAIEQQKGALLGTLPAPFGGASFKKYYRALECIDDNGAIAETKKEQVKRQIAQERCAREMIDALEKDAAQNPAAGAALGQARQLLRSIRAYSGFDRDKLVTEIEKVRKQKSALAKLFPSVFGQSFNELYLTLYDLDFGLGKAFRLAQGEVGKAKQRKELVRLLASLRRIVHSLDAHIQAKQLYVYEFAGLHLSFTGPLDPPKQYSVDVEGAACGSDPLKVPWHIQLVATDVPGPNRDISFALGNPAGLVNYRWVENGTEVGTVSVKLLLVAGASPRMELQADKTGERIGAITINPSRNSLKLTKVPNC